MPRKPRLPKYGLHKPSGQARVLIAGRHVYLGRQPLPVGPQHDGAVAP